MKSRKLVWSLKLILNNTRIFNKSRIDFWIRLRESKWDWRSLVNFKGSSGCIQRDVQKRGTRKPPKHFPELASLAKLTLSWPNQIDSWQPQIYPLPRPHKSFLATSLLIRVLDIFKGAKKSSSVFWIVIIKPKGVMKSRKLILNSFSEVWKSCEDFQIAYRWQKCLKVHEHWRLKNRS